jgi:shikimate kinase
VNTAASSIVLIGFMGAGKSAVGRELARRTGLPRRDTDELIRQRFGLSIPEIFAEHGERGFREAETELLKTIKNSAILVTGGGIVLREENVRRLRALGRTVWLDADEETLWRRVSRRSTRPLLHGPNPREKFAALLRERLPLYEAAADDRVDTSAHNITEVADQILCLA